MPLAPVPHPTPTRPKPLFELLITIIVPAVILMQLSSEHRLGVLPALLLALAFPLGWGLYDGIRRRKLNGFAVLGLVSTLLTGGIGVLELDARWLAVKEAAVPGLIGVAVLVSGWTRNPLVRMLVYNPAVVDVDRVHQALVAQGKVNAFESRLRLANTLLAGTFFFSSVMNFLLATWIVTSPAGTEAFNAELGRLTLLSYPVIALPSMVMMMGILFLLARVARGMTGLTLAQLLRQDEDEDDAGRPGPAQGS